MERERSHFISISNSSKLNQHESGSSLPKLKGKAILFVGSYPPPYGGGSSLLAGLGKSFESVGCKYHVLHFYGKTEPSEFITFPKRTILKTFLKLCFLYSSSEYQHI